MGDDEEGLDKSAGADLEGRGVQCVRNPHKVEKCPFYLRFLGFFYKFI